MKTLEDLIDAVDNVSSDSPDVTRPLIVEDQDGRLLEVVEIRKDIGAPDGPLTLVAGDEIPESRRL